MTLAHDDGFRRSVEDFIRERLTGTEVLSVTVEEGPEDEDAPVLSITVTFDGTPADFARSEPLGFLRGLREHVVALGDPSFPVVGFRPSRLVDA